LLGRWSSRLAQQFGHVLGVHGAAEVEALGVPAAGREQGA
jgi:hypothetical protein